MAYFTIFVVWIHSLSKVLSHSVVESEWTDKWKQNGNENENKGPTVKETNAFKNI